LTLWVYFEQIARACSADSLAAKAKNGYSGVCRQDYIGADYGMVDCITGSPLPDFYTALLWAMTMGPTVLDSTAVATAGGKAPPAETSAIRVYAQCSTSGPQGSVTVLAINLGSNTTVVHFGAAGGGVVEEYVLTPSGDAAASLSGVAGLMGTNAELNGALLKLGAGGALPAVVPAAKQAADATAPPTSVAFFVLPQAKHPAC